MKELRASSDSVLLGTFGQKAGTQRDNGGNPADTEGIPVAFYEFVVSRVLSGRARARLFVVSIDQNEVPSTSSLPPAGLPGLLDIDLAELELAVNQKP